MTQGNPAPVRGTGLQQTGQSESNDSPETATSRVATLDRHAGCNVANLSERWYQAYARAYMDGVRDGYGRAYDDGRSDGYASGHAAALAEIQAADDRAWAELSARVRRQAGAPRFSQLSDKREDRDRAEIARAHERRMGLGLAG